MLTSSSSLRKAPAPFASGGPPLGTHKVDVKELHVLLLRQRVSNMFRRYVPAKLHRLDVALMRYHGKEELLLKSLVAKFGPEPAFTAEQQQLSDALNTSMVNLGLQPMQTQTCDEYNGRKHRNLHNDFGATLPPHAASGLSATGSDLDTERSDLASGRRCRTTSPTDTGLFPATVALVAQHHQSRTRLYEAYTAKRSIVRLQEEKDREQLLKLMSFEFRHLTSQLTRKQNEALLAAQKEKVHQMEAFLISKRQEEMRAAYLVTQSNTLFQKLMIKREDIMSDERIERRQVHKVFSDDLVKLFRAERRIARLREAAEEESRKLLFNGNGGGNDSGRERVETRQRQLLEVELSRISQGSSGLSSSVPWLPNCQKKVSGKNQQKPSKEFSLFDDLGTAVSYSVSTLEEQQRALQAPQQQAVSLPKINAHR